MKKLFGLIIRVTVFACTTSFAHAASDSVHAQEQKIYLKKDRICVTDDEMFVNINGTSILINSLFRDAQGLYVLQSEIKDSQTFSWTCPLGHKSPKGTGFCRREGCQFYHPSA